MRAFKPRLAVLEVVLIVSLEVVSSVGVAQDFFDSLFGGGNAYTVSPSGNGYYAPPRARRDGPPPWAYRRTFRRAHAIARKAARSSQAEYQGPRFTCLRTCDGYTFPLPESANDLSGPRKEATCRSLCPNAETKLQSVKSVEKTESFRDVLLASRTPSGPGCFCQGIASDQERTQALLTDRTLRKGDSVMTPQGLRVFRGADHFPFKPRDFAALSASRGLGSETRSLLAAIERRAPKDRNAGRPQ